MSDIPVKVDNSTTETITTYYKGSGCVKKTHTLVNGKMHGKSTHFYLSGTKSHEKHWEHGIQHGEEITWYRSGSLQSECNYVNGNKHGLYRDYHENGKLWEESWYVHGKEHGYSAIHHLRDEDEISEYIYCNGDEVTNEVISFIKDIKNITDYEKTVIAIHTGIIL